MAASPTGSRSTSAGSTPSCSSRPTATSPPSSSRCTASSSPAASASAAARARSPASASPASATCPSSASASACRWPASKARANTAGHRRARSTTEFGPTDEPVVGLITEWMSAEGLQKREAGGDLGGTMRLGAYDGEARPATAVVARDLRQRPRSASATATATRSTPTIATRWRRAGSSSPACRPTASCPRSSSGPTIPGSSASSSIPS